MHDVESVLSDDLLHEVWTWPSARAAAFLRNVINGELLMQHDCNPEQARAFAKMLEETMQRYDSGAIESGQVVEELIALAEDIREGDH